MEPTVNQKQRPSPKIEIIKDGPYRVSGGLPLSEQWIVTNAEGESLERTRSDARRLGRSPHRLRNSI